MTGDANNPLRRDWDARARHAMRLYVATWYAHSDETWAEGTRRDVAYLVERLPARLGPGQACLDLGCGAGRMLPGLATRFARVTGVDVSPEMLAQARQLVAGEPRISLQLVDGHDLAGLADASFHFVLANAVFIHCERAVITSLLAEAARVLAPGGLLAATFGCAEPPPAVPEHVRVLQRGAAPRERSEAGAGAAALPPPRIEAADLALIGGPTWDGARFTRAELLAALQAAGLQPASLEPMDTVWNVLADRAG